MSDDRDPQNGSMGMAGDDVATQQQESGHASRPQERLNKDEPSTEGTGAPVRKSSLLGD